MPSKPAKSTGKRAPNVSGASDASSGDFASPPAKTPSSNRKADRSSATKRPSSSPKKKPRPQRSPPPSPRSPTSSSSDPDAYAAEVLASSSSIGDDSDVFDPTKASDAESETAQRHFSRRSNASRMTTASSAVESPLESELDEEDLDIGLNYHAKRVSPKKRPSSSSPAKYPTKRRSTVAPSKKRKRDEYSDVAPSDSEEDGGSAIVENEVPSKSRRSEKKAAVKSATKKTMSPRQPAKKKKNDDSDIDDDEGRFTVVGKIVQAPTTGRGEPFAKHLFQVWLKQTNSL
jgi:hypothetical protein